MILLQWKGTLRFGPWVRAALGGQRVFLVVWAVLGLALGVWLWVLGAQALAVASTVGIWLFPVVLVVLSVASVLRRLRRVHRTALLEQWYSITAEALEISLGHDRASIPLGELRVVGSGPDWVAAQRRGMGRRKVFLYADDPAVVPRVVDLVSRYGAAR